MEVLLQFFNIFFFIFHTALTLFNLLGWIWRSTRFLNLISILLTFSSWFILGIWYGWGYCPCTDWHWEVRQELGYKIQTHSYIKFLFSTITGLEIPAFIIEMITVTGLVMAFLLSSFTNYRDMKKEV
ncbi:MAG: DUF2784 domain-containing protein [Bacteroidetes bacterium SW_11_45_7]|nr:MAG: DUF2784 domain-containing protein [Bacteroidetes bacterium SW_11_45_7]